jgi:hypothetical protein
MGSGQACNPRKWREISSIEFLDTTGSGSAGCCASTTGRRPGDLGSPEVEACVLDSIRSWTFTPPPETTWVSDPFVLKTEDEP